MMKKMSFCAIAIFLMSSCSVFDFDELCYSHFHTVSMNMHFDWTECPEANPGQMTVFLYNADDQKAQPMVYVFDNSDGGKMDIPFGHYKMLALNTDTESILTRGTSDINTFELYTRNSTIKEGSNLSLGPESHTKTGLDERYQIILEPDQVWAGVSGDVVKCSPDDVDGDIVISLERRVCHLRIDLTNVPNIKKTETVIGTLSGVVRSVFAADGHTSDTPAAIAFSMNAPSDNNLVADIFYFGRTPSDDEIHMTLLTSLSDGTLWQYDMDVTPLMDSPSTYIDSHNRHLVIDNEIPIPTPISSGSGFDPEIGGWEDVEYNYTIK